MISKIKGKLLRLTDNCAVLDIPPFEYDVMIPDFTRRHLQLRVNETVELLTIHYMDGNPAQGGKLTPRLVGFISEIEREFFDLFCSVDGVGVKKALRAMVRPVQEVAEMIENQDGKGLSTLPGVGAATADRVIAKLRRKMPKFVLLVQQTSSAGESEIEVDIVQECFNLLLTLGHGEADARQLIDSALETKKKYKDVEALMTAVYQKTKS